MNDYIVKVRVSRFVWVPYQVLANSISQAAERALEQHLIGGGFTYSNSVNVIELGPKHQDRISQDGLAL